MATATSGDGTQIDWSERGDGPPVVLVHGITESARSWDPVAERLAAGHRVITLDLRGHGRSARAAAGDYSLAALAADVGAAIGASGAERPHLVGHSLGGVVVSVVASRLPVASITNVDQPLQLAGFKEQVGWFEAELRDPTTFAAVMSAVFDFMVGDQLPVSERARLVALRQAERDVVLGIWSMLLEDPPHVIAATIDAWLTAYRGPYLSLFGIDPGPDYADWLTARIPTAEVELWSGFGHYPHLVEPDDFVDRLQAFWSTV